MMQFPSQSDFDSAFRITVRKGRLYRLEKVLLPYLLWNFLLCT